MEDLLIIVIVRALIRGIGLHTRYLFFWVIGQKRTLNSLSNKSKDDYKDLGKALTQDFFNSLVGGIVLVTTVLVVVILVFD